MDKTKTDCVFFLTSSCTKGANCEFRHCTATLTNPVLCRNWIKGGCPNDNCAFRHPTHFVAPPAAPINRSTTPCYWLTQPGGCKKGATCMYYHPPDGNNTTESVSSSSPSTTTSTTSSSSISSPTSSTSPSSPSITPLSSAPAPLPTSPSLKIQTSPKQAKQIKPSEDNPEQKSKGKIWVQNGNKFERVTASPQEKKQQSRNENQENKKERAKIPIRPKALIDDKKTKQIEQETKQNRNFGVKSLSEILKTKSDPTTNGNVNTENESAQAIQGTKRPLESNDQHENEAPLKKTAFSTELLEEDPENVEVDIDGLDDV